MHEFSELIYRCTIFTLKTLENINEKTIAELQTSSPTNLVKTLQMIQLQKVILAVGMFSIFEANLQDRLSCKDGFKEADKILDAKGATDLKNRLSDLKLAINVLKHGHGSSYNMLIRKIGKLPFRVKLLKENFFSEGNISEVLTLIEVDDQFVQYCNDVIKEVSDLMS